MLDSPLRKQGRLGLHILFPNFYPADLLRWGPTSRPARVPLATFEDLGVSGVESELGPLLWVGEHFATCSLIVYQRSVWGWLGLARDLAYTRLRYAEKWLWKATRTIGRRTGWWWCDRKELEPWSWRQFRFVRFLGTTPNGDFNA